MRGMMIRKCLRPCREVVSMRGAAGVASGRSKRPSVTTRSTKINKSSEKITMKIKNKINLESSRLRARVCLRGRPREAAVLAVK